MTEFPGAIKECCVKLEPPDTHYFNSAQGWLELGNPSEAAAELDKISFDFQAHPDVLEVRWRINADVGQWQRCVEVAGQLVNLAPEVVAGWIQRSFALHELKQTREAMELLLPALTRFPEEWLIQYNLACYSCRLQKFEQALRFLDQAGRLSNAREIKMMALNDADLKELWEKIRSGE